MNPISQPTTEPKPSLQAALDHVKAGINQTPEDAITHLIRNTGKADFNALAEKYLGHELRNAEGNPRKPTAKESRVIITEHFKEYVNNAAGGLAEIDGAIHYFTGKHWQPIEEKELGASLGLFAEAMGHSVTESRYYEDRKKLAEQLNEITPKITPPNKQAMVNFSNGTLKIEDHAEQLSDHDKHHGFTYVLPFAYDHEAASPLFTRYLERVLPDEESQGLLAEFFGWIFLRDLKLEKMLVMLGHGHNGKSVLFDILTALLGSSNISSIGFESLRKPESRLPLLGKLLNYGSEIAGSVPPDILKKASSGESLEFRQLYKDLVTSDNYARLAFNANNLPSLTEQTEGFFRRFLIIPFEETITTEERDPNLARKIIADELPGVMKWVLDGMRRVRSQQGFSPCRKSDECLKRYKLESDSVALFLDDEGYHPAIEGKIAKGDFYDYYKSYCFENGYRSCGKRNFGERLTKQHGIYEGRNGSMRYWQAKRKTGSD